jgi:hypothetical protein
VTKSCNHTQSLHRLPSNSSSTSNFPWLFPTEKLTQFSYSVVLRCTPILLVLSWHSAAQCYKQTLVIQSRVGSIAQKTHPILLRSNEHRTDHIENNSCKTFSSVACAYFGYCLEISLRVTMLLNVYHMKDLKLLLKQFAYRELRGLWSSFNIARVAKSGDWDILGTDTHSGSIVEERYKLINSKEQSSCSKAVVT